MKKNLLLILLILIVPLIAYWGLARDKSVSTQPSMAFSGAEILKFSSPMCYECQELEKVFDEVYPKYASKVTLRKIDVTKHDAITKKLIKEYNVQLVPTCVFKGMNGETIRRTEGSMQSRILENYIKEQING